MSSTFHRKNKWYTRIIQNVKKSTQWSSNISQITSSVFIEHMMHNDSKGCFWSSFFFFFLVWQVLSSFHFSCWTGFIVHRDVHMAPGCYDEPRRTSLPSFIKTWYCACKKIKALFETLKSMNRISVLFVYCIGYVTLAKKNWLCTFVTNGLVILVIAWNSDSNFDCLCNFILFELGAKMKRKGLCVWSFFR